MRRKWWREASDALKASGSKGASHWFLTFPLGRERRLRAAMGRRRSVLTTKNNVVDYLFRAQAALARLELQDLSGVTAALRDPDKRRLIATFGVDRTMLEKELRSRYDSDTSVALDETLVELVSEGYLLSLPGGLTASNSDLLLAVLARPRPSYDVSELSRLLREGRNRRRELQARSQHKTSTGGERTYRM